MVVWPYRDAQNRLLWRDKTCTARTWLIMSWKANLLLLLLSSSSSFIIILDIIIIVLVIVIVVIIIIIVITIIIFINQHHDHHHHYCYYHYYLFIVIVLIVITIIISSRPGPGADLAAVNMICKSRHSFGQLLRCLKITAVASWACPKI